MKVEEKLHQDLTEVVKILHDGTKQKDALILEEAEHRLHVLVQELHEFKSKIN